MKERDGVIGLKDFRGDLIRMFQKEGFIYHSEVVIYKNPVTEMQRTKALGLLHKQIRKDSAMCRQGIPDYVVTMRKPGENPERIEHTMESFPVNVWQRYASPVWMDIKQSETLQRNSAREEKDERHICFAEGTLILTKRGYVPIENIIVGEDETLTHKGRWRKIIGKAMTQENADVIQTCAVGVPYLKSTPNHKLFAKKGYGTSPKDNLHRVQPEWIEAQNCAGAYLCSHMPPIEDSDISADEWWVIGRWLADGHVDVRDKQFFISVGTSKIKKFRENAKNYLGSEAFKSESNCYQIGLKGLSSSARSILKKCGKGALNKVVPYEAMSLNPELSKAFVDGYLSGDGCYLENGKIMAESVSRALLLGIAIAYKRAYGKTASIYQGTSEREKEIDGRTVHCHRTWVMTISPNYSYNYTDNDNVEWRKVMRIRDAGTSNVWSIQVDEDASYTAEGCVVKNCPLQLGVIKRCIELWTNPGDTVLDPFAGIGSTPYMALRLGRKSIGVELKESYYNQAVSNCTQAMQMDVLTDLADEKEESSAS